MNDEKDCRRAFDDFYHKIKAEVSYGHWCVIWRFISKRQARGEPIGEVLPFLMGGIPKTHSTLAGLKDPQPVGMLVYAAPLPHQIPEGYKLVPVEPTVEMLFACQDAGSISNHQRGKRIYKAMLEAAPEVKG